MKTQISNLKNQAGQTIIETLAAIFILVTTLTVGLGLAISTLSNAESSMKEVIAMNLAREGIEVVRMMRDSNWIAGEATNAGGFDLETCADIDALCYPQVFTGGVNGNPQFSNNFDLSTPSNPVCDFSSTNCSTDYFINKVMENWATDPVNHIYLNGLGSGFDNFSLWLNKSESVRYGSYGQDGPPGCTDPITCPAEFLRKIKLTRINTPPFTNTNSNWELVVNVYVAWQGKRCNNNTANQDPEFFNTTCKIVLEERLTNWKDYR
jgi:hypothetical protein